MRSSHLSVLSFGPKIVFWVLACASTSLVLPAASGSPPTRAEWEGTLVVRIADDFEHDRATTSYLLRDIASGREIELSLTPDQASRIQPGQRLRVRGGLSGDLILVDRDRNGIQTIAETVAAAPAIVQRRAVALLVDITDQSNTTYAVDESCDGPNQVIADEMFGSHTGRYNTDGCFNEGSYGAIGFGGANYPGTALDVVRVGITDPDNLITSQCDFSQWARDADIAATAKGVNLASYQHRVYILPSATACSWAGLAYVRCGDNCQAWSRAYGGSRACGYPAVIAHELGHNIGLMHARTDENNDGVSDCEYCDTSDVMGYAVDYWRTFNAPHRSWMGWLGSSRIFDGSTGGTYRISALELESAGDPQNVTVVTSSGKKYWISYRDAIGYDANLIGQPGYFDGNGYLEKTQVHYADASGYSYLVASVSDGVLAQPEEALEVTQLSHDSESALVLIKSGDACTGQPVPSDLAPTEKAANVLPASRNFVLTLRNIQNESCGAVTWPLEPIVPSGWTATISNPTPTIEVGAFIDVTLVVKAPIGTAEGYHPVGIKMVSNSTHPAVDLKGVVIIDTSLPNIAVDYPVAGATYAQNLTVNAAYTCSDVVSYITECVGTVAPGTSIDTKTLGAKSFVVKATDRAGNVRTTTINYSVVARDPAFTLSPTSIAFGNQPTGSGSAPRAVTFSNTGNVPLTITSIALSGANPSQFAYQSNCATTVPIGGTCLISTYFAPTTAGSKTGKLDVKVGATIKSVALAGTGTTTTPVIALSPTSLVFGGIKKGTTSAPKVVTVSNTGAVTAKLETVSIVGTNVNQFQRTSSCPSSLPVGGQCTVSVVFKPTTVGLKTAKLKVKPTGGTAKTTTLTGTGK